MRDLTVVFDLDGTLIDTAPDIIRATNHALGLVGIAPRPEHELRPMISAGSRAMLAHVLGREGRTTGAAEIERLFTALIAYYTDNIAVDSRPFPSMTATLDRLRDRGACLAVCTNKREAPARLLLETLGLLDRFQALAGVDTYPYCKPDPRHLTEVIRTAGGEPGRAIMVGDSDTDVTTAKAAGVPVIAVTFGYPDPARPIHSLGAEAVIDHYRHLEAAIDRIRAG